MNNQSTAEYLSAHEFFSEFSGDSLKFLCECSSIREINKGQILRYPHEFTLPPTSRSNLLKELVPAPTLRWTTQRRHSGRRFGQEK